MDYKKKIEEYRLRIKNKEILKFVEFLDTLLEWIDLMYKFKRLSKRLEKEILQYMPTQTFEALDFISPTELSPAVYDELKKILLREISELIHAIVLIGNLRMYDFDLLQFNLSQIFKKEEIASMIETARLHLSDVILAREEEKLKEREEKRKAEEEYLKKIRAMPQKELNKLAIRSMFDFTPGARTPEERLDAIQNNKKNVLTQKARFRKFEEKLIDATTEARTDAQSKVYRQIGGVKRGMAEVMNRFREKAKKLASEEGPKKQIRKARDKVLGQKNKLQREIKEKGKDWEENFGVKVKEAQGRILDKEKELIEEIKIKGKDWEENFGRKIKHAQKEMLKEKKKLLKEQKERMVYIDKKGKAVFKKARKNVEEKAADFADDVQAAKEKFSGKAEEVLEKGRTEIKAAREMILKEKTEFGEEVEEAREKFSGKAKEIEEAKTGFIEKRDLAEEKFKQRANEVGAEMYGTIYQERKRFEKERLTAQEKFTARANEIKGGMVSYIEGKKGRFAEQRGEAQEKFLGKAKEIQEKGTLNMVKGKKRMEGFYEQGKRFKEKVEGFRAGRKIEKKTVGTEAAGRLVSKAEEAKEKIGVAQARMMNRSKGQRKKMEEGIRHRKELFLYNVRFARYNMQEHAKQFAEGIAAKKEEFATKQTQIVSRHRAKQKAHLIRNLLRVIRGMR